MVTSLLEAYGAAERIFKIEDTLPETEEPVHPVTCGEIQTIEFKNVSFAYPGTERKILEHFNYVIHKGCLLYTSYSPSCPFNSFK